MKRMESKIALTFAIMFIVGVIINGIYMAIFDDLNPITVKEVLVLGLFMALLYIVFVWINTRRHQMLILIGVTCCALVAVLCLSSLVGGAGVVFSSFSNNWKQCMIWGIYGIISSQIASYQGRKLLEEKWRRNRCKNNS